MKPPWKGDAGKIIRELQKAHKNNVPREIHRKTAALKRIGLSERAISEALHGPTAEAQKSPCESAPPTETKPVSKGLRNRRKRKRR